MIGQGEAKENGIYEVISQTSAYDSRVYLSLPRI